MNSIDEKYSEVFEKLDWMYSAIYQNGDIELETWSPAGEDIVFDVNADNLVYEVRCYANNFDVDDHVLMWAEHRGENGVPNSIRELLDDAESIQDMLNELADALEEVK